MGRGYLFGLLSGALFSSVSVGVLSLMLPPLAPIAPPETSDATASPSPEATVTMPAEAPVATPPEAPTEQPAPDATAAVADPGEIAAEAPEPPAAPDTPATEAAEAPLPATTEPLPSEATGAVASAPETGAAETNPPVSEAAAPEVSAPADRTMEPAQALPAEPADTASDMATPENAPVPEQSAAAAPLPDTPVVVVPAGSEFDRPKPEVEPVVPAPQAAPAAASAPTVSEPAAEAQPELTENTPAAVPESQATSPANLAEPPAGLPTAISEAPAGESAIPVSPPGDAGSPALAPAPTSDDMVTMSQDDAPGPIEAVEPEPAPGKRAGGNLPQIIAPETPAPSDDTATEPDPGTEPAAAPAATLKPRFLTPGTRSAASNDGPVIIDVAPQGPIGVTAGPKIGFKKVPGVEIKRAPTSTGDGPAPGAAAAGAAAAQPSDRAVDRYAAAFANPERKPVVGVILIDDGSSAGLDPDSVSAIGAPLTIAIDPESNGAAARAQTFRLGGDEVAILAPALPAGATPSDVEVSYQGLLQILPEAVALIASPDSTLQEDRMLAQHMAALLGADGRAFVTYAQGLNPARQVAGRAGTPYAGIVRSLDEAEGDDAAIGRLLDRAAFEAAQSGAVLIVGHATPATVSALKGWIASGRKDAVIGPLSAVIAR